MGYLFVGFLSFLSFLGILLLLFVLLWLGVSCFFCHQSFEELGLFDEEGSDNFVFYGSVGEDSAVWSGDGSGVVV